MKSIPQITIGIPAYNEGQNLIYLLHDIQKQKQTDWVLDNIIVALDGSNDNSAQLLSEQHIKDLVVLDDSNRKGKAQRLNEIIEKSESDILVLLDADTKIIDPSFISKLVYPLINEKVDLSSPALIPIKAKTFVEKTLECSMSMKNYIFDTYKNGDNVFTCHGPARAFSKKLYINLRFPLSTGDDAYSYMFCKKNKYSYKYVSDTAIYFRGTTTIKEHTSQSLRFFDSIKQMSKIFGIKFVVQNYYLPINLILKSVIINLLKSPIYMTAYIPLVIFTFSKSLMIKRNIKPNLWMTAKSSKTLR